jgi:hypothetical protein
VRYTFFAALLSAGNIKPEIVILELPHPKIARAELDTWIAWPDGKTTAVEFKYHRAIPSGKNAPRPMKAGELFRDLFRLFTLFCEGQTECYFVYVTDGEMAGYLTNVANGLAGFFDLGENESLPIDKAYFAARSATLQGSVGDVVPVVVTSVVRRDLPRNHALRVYSVHPHLGVTTSRA